jgi:hypothetical protein
VRSLRREHDGTMELLGDEKGPGCIIRLGPGVGVRWGDCLVQCLQSHANPFLLLDPNHCAPTLLRIGPRNQGDLNTFPLYATCCGVASDLIWRAGDGSKRGVGDYCPLHRRQQYHHDNHITQCLNIILLIRAPKYSSIK